MARTVNQAEYAAKRKDILAATQRLVFTKGYERMTIQDILADVQISSGAFYHYFDSKPAVLEAFIWQLATSRLLVFHDRVSDGQVTMVARLVREFIAAGRGTDARYTVRLLREPHQFQVVTQGRHEEVCVAAGTALRIDYRLTSVAGFAIFRDQAGLTDLTAQRWAWLWERPKHIYIGG